MAHLKLIFVFLLIGVTMIAGMNLQKRIAGGKPCKKEERKYHVQLKIVTTEGKYMCGGSLISKTWILTAAHCLGKGKLKTIKAILRIHPNQKFQTPVEIKKDPQIYSVGKVNHDIMMLELDKATDIDPVELPQDCINRHKLLQTVQVAGHGPTPFPGQKKKEGPMPNDLQCIELGIVKCPGEKSFEHQMCYQKQKKDGRKDTCPGDSGGGVVYDNQIYGVHGGSFSEFACMAPAYFLDVCEYLQWIQDKINPK